MDFPAIDPVLFEIGPFAVRWYGLAYLVGFVAGWRYAIRLARRVPDLKPTDRDVDDFLVWAVVGTVIGGRLGYVLFYQPGVAAADPLSVIRIWEGGMSFHGGLAGVAVAMIVFARARAAEPLALSDLIAAAAPIGLFFGRIANYINAELYGRPTDVPWGVIFPTGGPLPRHPSQLYEAALEGLLLFVVLFVLTRRQSIMRRPGILTGVFVTGYGLSRFMVEFFREPDPQLGYLVFGTTMGQLLSLPMIVAGAGLILYGVYRQPVAQSAVSAAPAGNGR
jgi:phosphatidylglycerol:prolipoprotein diacylglycerol transferase